MFTSSLQNKPETWQIKTLRKDEAAKCAISQNQRIAKVGKASEIIKSIQGKTKADEDREIQLHHLKNTRNEEKEKAETFNEVLKENCRQPDYN